MESKVLHFNMKFLVYGDGHDVVKKCGMDEWRRMSVSMALITLCTRESMESRRSK